MTQIVSGRSGEIEGDSMQEFLDDEAQQWGESDLDEDAVMEGRRKKRETRARQDQSSLWRRMP